MLEPVHNMCRADEQYVASGAVATPLLHISDHSTYCSRPHSAGVRRLRGGAVTPVLGCRGAHGCFGSPFLLELDWILRPSSITSLHDILNPRPPWWVPSALFRQPIWNGHRALITSAWSRAPLTQQRLLGRTTVSIGGWPTAVAREGMALLEARQEVRVPRESSARVVNPREWRMMAIYRRTKVARVEAAGGQIVRVLLDDDLKVSHVSSTFPSLSKACADSRSCRSAARSAGGRDDPVNEPALTLTGALASWPRAPHVSAPGARRPLTAH